MGVLQFLQKEETRSRLRLDSRERFGCSWESLNWRERYDAIVTLSADVSSEFGAYWNGFTGRMSFSDLMLSVLASKALQKKGKSQPIQTPADGAKNRALVIRAYILDSRDSSEKRSAKTNAEEQRALIKEAQRIFTENLKKQQNPTQ